MTRLTPREGSPSETSSDAAQPRNAPLPRPDLDDRWFRAVANCTHDWESWHAPEGTLVWVNPAVERLTGYSPRECLDMADYPLPIIAREDKRLFNRAIQRAKALELGNDIEFRVNRRDGARRWMAMSWQPMFDTDDRHLGFRTSIRDITERWNLRNRFRQQANRLEAIVQERTARIRKLEEHRRKMEQIAALGELAHGVAHEINNPLAGIRNAFELFKSGTSPEHPHFDLIDLIDREIERISGIIHHLYQLYRREPQPAIELALADAAHDVVRLLGSVARQHAVTLVPGEVDCDDRVRLPEGEVKQILYNLVRNAIQASEGGSNVDISLAAGAGEIAVEVEDRGTGIAPELLSRIFEPYFTTKPSRPSTGMGLGLSISRSLIESMGGRIEVESQPGRGSRFRAVFPRTALKVPEDRNP